jgi:hypothetical protein
MQQDDKPTKTGMCTMVHQQVVTKVSRYNQGISELYIELTTRAKKNLKMPKW